MTLRRASASTARSPRFEVKAALLLICASAAALLLSARQGWTLWYGDAEAHLNIARRILDSRTPGYEQLGTVWLPLPHLLMLPFVQADALWRSGVGGAIAAAICFICGGLFLFHGLRRLFGVAEAWAGLLVWTLNPNLLYLQSIPMTEPVALACALGLLWAITRLEDTTAWGDAALAGVFAALGTLARYEAWSLLPVAAVCVVVLAGERRWGKALLFCLIASLGPLYWLAHNRVLYSSALEFYNGPWSAHAIYQRALDAGGFRYPGDHDWIKALLYYRTAAALCLGRPLYYLGAAGLAAALFSRARWAALLLFTGAAFYVFSLYSGGTPIFVPELWPNTYYNTRYGLSAMPAACLGVAALAGLAARAPRLFRPPHGQWIAAGVLVLLAVSPWLLRPRPGDWVCWRESDVNSRDRRAWTRSAAGYLAPRYHSGDGILISFGDLTGIVRAAGIPLRETLHEGNGPAWLAAVLRPDIALHEEWALAFAGDTVSRAVSRLREGAPQYQCVSSIPIPDGRAVEIWKRTHSHENPLHQGAWGAERFPADLGARSAAAGVAGAGGGRHLPPALGARR
ncbi:MAG: glycosyltransferase family 39 protein [Bryobacteraceae bacterium]|jgi:hypothetical protein